MPVSPANLILILLLCQLMEHLSKPRITSGLQNNKNGTCVANLTCFLEWGGEDVTYSWNSLGMTSNESHNGSILPITWRQEEEDMAFICMARNPISSNSSNPIFARKLCEEKSNKEKRTDTHLEILNCYPPSGETSEYYTISNPNTTIPEENSINSLYSTVQMPPKVEKPHSLPTSPDKSTLFTYEKVI
uniref:SLAM family member 7 n=1 Tax=Pipistrellus kuhlii TaxID=59472 RepID=A0A7J7UUV8_PIPKU|nr:SLAM family member 7 [Pipistrellus kuhlii]